MLSDQDESAKFHSTPPRGMLPKSKTGSVIPKSEVGRSKGRRLTWSIVSNGVVVAGCRTGLGRRQASSIRRMHLASVGINAAGVSVTGPWADATRVAVTLSGDTCPERGFPSRMALVNRYRPANLTTWKNVA